MQNDFRPIPTPTEAAAAHAAAVGQSNALDPTIANSFTTATDLQSAMIEPLAVASEPLVDPRTNKPVVSHATHPKWKPNKAMLWTGMAILFATTLVILLILLVSVSRNNAAKDLDKQTYPNTEIPLTDLTVGDPLTLGQIGSLDVNGTVSVNGSLVLSPTAAPTNPTTGQLFTDSATNILSYFNGTSLKNVAMTGDSITNITGRRNQITATKTGTDVALSLPQDIATGSTPTFADLVLKQALSILNGGTGATTAEQARANLSVASSGTNNDITSLGSLTGLRVQNTANQSIFEIDSENLTVRTGDLVPLEVGSVTPGVSSLVLDPNEGAGLNGTAVVRGPDGYMRILSSDRDRKISYVRCTNKACTTRVVTSIDSGVGGGFSGVALVIGLDGFARLAYTNGLNRNILMYARCTDNDCTNPVITTIDSANTYAGNWGVNLTIAPDGFARFAYYAGAYGTNTSTYYAQCTDDDCTSPVITYFGENSYGYDVGSIAIGPDGFARITYEGDDELLRFVRCTTADCSGRIVTNPDPNIKRAYEGTALEFGSDGFARIAYLSNPGDDWLTSQLWYARCTDIDCSAPVITKISDTSLMYNGFGFALGSDDNPWFSYDEQNTRALHVVHCLDINCSSSTTAIVARPKVEKWPGEGTSAYAHSIALGIDGLPTIAFADGYTGLRFSSILTSTGNNFLVNGTNIGTTDRLFGQAYLQGLSIQYSSASSLLSLDQHDFDGALMDFRYRGDSVGVLSAQPGTMKLTGNLSVDGLLKINGSSVNVNEGVTDDGFIYTYKNLIGHSGWSNITGTMEIVMPKGWSRNMMRIHISGYNYSGGSGEQGAWEATIGGYNFDNVGSEGWYNTSASIIGNAPFSTVRLGYNGTKCVLLLGTTSTTWNYPKITVDELQTGRGDPTGWETGWSMSFITTEPAYTHIDAPPLTSPVLQRGNSLGVAMSLGTNDNNQLNFETNNTTRWSVLTSGTLQSSGAQTIQTSTGNLNLATAGGNGDIILAPNGTGKVGIGSVINQVCTSGTNCGNGDNLLPNGDFEVNTLAGWSTVGGAGTLSVVTGGSSGRYAMQSVDKVDYLSNEFISVDPTKDVLQLEGYFKETATGTTPGGLYFGYIAYDANGVQITSAPCGTFCYFAAANYNLPVDGNWHKFSATTSGEGVAYPNFPIGTKYVKVLVLANYGSAGGETTLMDHVSVRKINNGPLYVGNDFTSTNMLDQNQNSKLFTNTSGVLNVQATNGVTARATNNYATAFQIQNATGLSILTVDTLNAGGSTILNTTSATAGATVVSIAQSGTVQGTITVNAGTVSYNAFTGSHYASLASGQSEPAYGTLMTLAGNSTTRMNDNGELIYTVATTQTPNDPKAFGSFNGQTDGGNTELYGNGGLCLVAASGNGNLWIADNGMGNITAGDQLMSSTIPGHAMKDPGTYPTSHIVAKAAQSIDWSTITTTDTTGTKVTKLSVFFTNYDKDNTMTILQGSNPSNTTLTIQNIDIATNLNVNGLTTLNELKVTGNVSFEGTLTVATLTVGDITIAGKVTTVGDAPSATAGIAAGVAAMGGISAPIVTVEGNDTAGLVTITTGSNSNVGELAKIAFNSAYKTRPIVNLTPGNIDASSLKYYYNATTNELSVLTSSAPADSTTYTFSYWIVQ